jgi:hypothetical protein
MMALLSSLKGLGMFLSTDFPSVKTLGYFQETQTLNRYVALTTRRKEYGISSGGVYWTKVQYRPSQCSHLISP